MSSRDDLLKLVVFVSTKTGIWFSIPEPVPNWKGAGVAVVLQCVMTSPYIDTLNKTIRLYYFRVPLKSLYGVGLLLAALAYLGWGRGGIHGAGSGSVGVGEELVPGGQP